MLALHLVARRHSKRIDLRAPPVAPVLWGHLRRRFPVVIVGLLMPDHVHLVVPPSDPSEARRELANLCGRVQAHLGWPRGSWESVPEPRVITKLDELRRHFRYASLNECRAGLALDPLEALWSTYREVFGTVVSPWSSAVEVLRRLKAPRKRPLVWLHQYVSGDPSAHPDGTPMPGFARLGRISDYPLTAVARAAAACLRASPEDIRRRLPARRVFIRLARATGWRNTTLLADACGVTPDAIRRVARVPDQVAVACAANCLGDPRLLARIPPAFELLKSKS